MDFTGFQMDFEVSGCKGQFVALGEELEKAWRHHLVPSGTVVDMKCRDQRFQVLLDKKLVADWPLKLPDDMDLYPLVCLESVC